MRLALLITLGPGSPLWPGAGAAAEAPKKGFAQHLQAPYQLDANYRVYARWITLPCTPTSTQSATMPAMSPVRFDAPWDLGLKFATATVLSLVAVIFAVSATRDFHGIPAALIAVPFLTTPLLLLLMAFLGAPRAYTVLENTIVIQQWSGRVTIPLSALREVRELAPQIGLDRVTGVGGFFGYWGDYYNKELGRVRLLATRSEGRVLLRGDPDVWVITPGEPARFVALVQERLDRNQLGPVTKPSQ